LKYSGTVIVPQGWFCDSIFLSFDHCNFILVRFLLILVVTIFLIACSGGGRVAPVDHLGAVPYLGPRPSYYIVRQGDTLYSIGWRFGLDYRTLAHWNGIYFPYIIYAGQKLRLTSPSARVAESQSTPLIPKSKQKVDKVGGQPKLADRLPLTRTKSISPKKAPTSENLVKATQGIYWSWPTRGKVIQNFSRAASDQKGIDIAGQLGQPVVAAADGKVVYSGMGLPRYGKLIIIKHDNSFLSAYAHNRLLVSEEGNLVKGGQKIAEMGHSGTDQVKLHFEIRHNGQPVDPLNYLPRQ
jgi:lipoprotein NlpD